MNIIYDINKDYDIVIVGCGFSGATMAQLSAKYKRILIIEGRDHIAGNMYDYIDENGILIHKYGPHIFHTNNEIVFNYLKSFTEFNPYEHKVLGEIDNQLLPIPFNFTSIDRTFKNATEVKNALIESYGEDKKITIWDLKENKNPILKDLGEFVYEKVFLNYTIKQWDLNPDQIDQQILKRVPIYSSYDNRYFKDNIQYMPKFGYTKLFTKMLESDNIDIMLNCNAKNLLTVKNNKIYFQNKDDKLIFYSGAIDSLFNFKYGRLGYRSLNFKFETHNKDFYQKATTVNYPNTHKYTRITEFKHFNQQEFNKNITTIVKEYPMAYNNEADNNFNELPYYPIIKDNNTELYKKYHDNAKEIENLILIGRLGEFKYFNMDQAVENAFNVFDKYKDKIKK